MVPTKRPTLKKDGRPNLLKPEVEKEFFAARELGLSLSKSAKRAGVTLRTIENWLDRGKKSADLPANKRSPFDQKCVDFFRTHEKIDTEWLYRAQIVFNLTLLPGQSENLWKMSPIEDRRLAFDGAKFMATHQASDEYSTRQEFSGPDGGPIEMDMTGMDVFAKMLNVKKFEEVTDDE